MRMTTLPKAHEGPSLLLKALIIAVLTLPAPLSMFNEFRSTNESPKKILGDQFVYRVKVIEQRATEINAIAADRIATAR